MDEELAELRVQFGVRPSGHRIRRRRRRMELIGALLDAGGTRLPKPVAEAFLRHRPADRRGGKRQSPRGLAALASTRAADVAIATGSATWAANADRRTNSQT